MELGIPGLPLLPRGSATRSSIVALIGAARLPPARVPCGTRLPEFGSPDVTAWSAICQKFVTPSSSVATTGLDGARARSNPQRRRRRETFGTTTRSCSEQGGEEQATGPASSRGYNNYPYHFTIF
jgi:hypothetical protein